MDFVMIWDTITGAFQIVSGIWREREIGTILFFVSAAIIYFRGHVKSEKLITHTVDVKTTEEMNALREKMATMLRVIESVLYSAVESFVYDHHGGKTRRLAVVRKSKPVDISAGDYLIEYHDALHKCVLESAPAVVLNEIMVHRVAESPVDEQQEQHSARALRELICFSIHGWAGTNRQVKELENTVLPYEEILLMYRELCVVARNLRAIRTEAVQKEILEHGIPLFPRLKYLVKGGKKNKNR